MTRIYTKKGDDGTHLALVRRPGAEVRRPHRGLRIAIDEAGSDARRGALALRRPSDARSRATSSGSRTTSSSPAPSSRPRPRPPTGSRTASAAITAEMVDALDADDRPLHGPGRPAAQVRDPRRDARSPPRSTSPAPSCAAPSGGWSRSRAAEELASAEVLRYLNRASDAVYAMARFTDVDDPELFAGRAGRADGDPATARRRSGYIHEVEVDGHTLVVDEPEAATAARTPGPPPPGSSPPRSRPAPRSRSGCTPTARGGTLGGLEVDVDDGIDATPSIALVHGRPAGRVRPRRGAARAPAA